MNDSPPRKEIEKEPNRQIIEIDVQYYQKYLENYDLSDAQKTELIYTIANIMLAFVDLGFGVEVSQLATLDVENFDKNFPFTVEEMLEWSSSTHEKDNDIVLCETNDVGGGT